MKAKSLQDLGPIRQQVTEAAHAAAIAEAARLEALRQAETERHLFTQSIGQVKPIAAKARVFNTPQRPTARPLQQDLDDQAALSESMSDEFDVSTLLDVDDQLSFRRPGIGTDVTRKLRKGEWAGDACAWCMARAWALPAKSRCSKAKCNAGWSKKMRCWLSCKPSPLMAAQGPWWCCSDRARPNKRPFNAASNAFVTHPICGLKEAVFQALA
jgi:hypothetical protein